MVNDGAKKFDGELSWWYLFIAVIFVGLSVFLYFYFTDFEQQGGSRRINWVLALLYDIGGKWTVIGAVQILVIFLCISCDFRVQEKKILEVSV